MIFLIFNTLFLLATKSTALDLVKEGYSWSQNHSTLPNATNWEFIYNLTNTPKCPSTLDKQCSCLLHRDECNYSGILAPIDDMQRYVLGDKNVIVCNQVRASMTCCTGSECEDTAEYYGNTYVFTLEEKVGGIAALFNVRDEGVPCDFCLDKSDNKTLVGNKEGCDMGYGWLRVPNATALEDQICMIEPIVPTRTINSSIVEITGGFDAGPPLSATSPIQLSAIKVGYRLSLQQEDFEPLYTGANSYTQYSLECDPSRTGCCTIKYKDSCSYPGIKILSSDSRHITAVVNETNVVMCGKTSTWDVCSDTFKYFGSNKYYELVQEEDSISVLSGIEGEGGCEDVCMNEEGDVVVSFSDSDSSSCVIGAGWLKVQNYTLDKCQSASSSISVNQTSIAASLTTTGTGYSTNTSHSHRVEPMSSTTDFPTFVPQPTMAPYETQEIPAASTATPPASSASRLSATPPASSASRLSTGVVLICLTYLLFI